MYKTLSYKNRATQILVALFIFFSSSSFDMGPKPSTKFIFTNLDSLELEIINEIILECQDDDCTDLVETHYWHWFTCEENICTTSMGGGQEYFIEITFSDGRTLRSNLIAPSNFNASYNVTIEADHLEAVEIGGRNLSFLWAFVFLGGFLFYIALIGYWIFLISQEISQKHKPKLNTLFSVISVILLIFICWRLLSWGILIQIPLTIIIETVVLSFYLFWRKKSISLKLLIVSAIASLITQSALWTFFPIIPHIYSMFFGLLIIEIVIVLIESWVLFLPVKRDFSYKEMLLISFIMNLVSFSIGLFLPI